MKGKWVTVRYGQTFRIGIVKSESKDKTCWNVALVPIKPTKRALLGAAPFHKSFVQDYQEDYQI